jgi:hypothetical protein
MPPKNRFSLEQTKAYQTEQLRLRTEKRLAQLRQDQRQLEVSEVLYLLSLIWLILIVMLYARLYLGPKNKDKFLSCSYCIGPIVPVLLIYSAGDNLSTVQ